MGNEPKYIVKGTVDFSKAKKWNIIKWLNESLVLISFSAIEDKTKGRKTYKQAAIECGCSEGHFYTSNQNYSYI